MDNSERKTAKNPREKANFLSIITFSWIWKTFLLGYKRDLLLTDLYSPLKEHTSSVLGERIVKVWDDEVRRCGQRKNAQPSLVKVIFRCFGRLHLLFGLAEAVMELTSKIFQPILLAQLLRCLRKEKKEWTNEIYYYSAGLILCLVVDCFLIHCSVHGLMHIGMKIRVAVSTLIYRKILKLSNSVLEGETSAGQMVNFLSTDVNRLEFAFQNVHYMWIGPVQTIIIAAILCQEIGWPGLLGIFTFLIFIPIQVGLGKKVSRLTFLAALRSDERLRLMNEVISGVQIIKMYVWEIPFSHLIEKARRKEVKALKKYAIIQEFTLTFDCYVPRLCIFATILAYVLLGNHIDAEKVYMITAFYSVLRSSMTFAVPLTIAQAFEGMVSIRRLQKFLLSSEISKSQVEEIVNDSEKDSSEDPPFSIILKNATAKWNDDTKENTLNGIDLSVKAGELVVIVGQVGAGKSSLLHAILEELPLSNGTLKIHGKIGYVSQQPWLFASSVRQNILFGLPMDRSRYNQVLRVCQLEPDLATLAHGDSTMVGEKGINLSGGQRARVNLARAVYADANVYLLDDPLSAVDARVGRKIVDECICGYLKGKTIVLVTHQVQHLANADRVVVMANGSIEIKGTYEELRSSETIFASITKSSGDDEGKNNEVKNGDAIAMIEKVEKISQEEAVLVEETRSTGQVSPKIYLEYFKACGSYCLIFFMLFLFLLYQVAASGSDYFIAFWVNIEETSFVYANDTRVFDWQGPLPRDWIIYLYSVMVAMVVLTCLLETVVYYNVCMRTSVNLHSNMFRSIIRTTMYFFNVNPMGRILNRFSKDTANIDVKLPLCMFDVIMIFLAVLAVIVIVGTVNPWLLVLFLLIVILFYFMRMFYVATSRSVKRLEGVTRSPVFDHVGATLQGLATVRAFKAEKILTTEFDSHQDLHSSSWFLYIATSRTFGMYLDLTCTSFLAVILLFFLFIWDIPLVSEIGLIITQFMSIIILLQWGMRQTAEMENQMISVERILEYSRLEEEKSLESKPETKPADTWPTNGLVEFDGVKLKYSPKGAYVLKDVNFTIMPKEKIGVVGRTGAGKTSLISALFRLAYVEGDIRIDGVSTSTLGLHDFRSKISIIPQEPILFAGSLRRNLDPFEEYSDDALWQALREVELKETINENPAGLNTRVSEGGLNFSVGQRQLLCLARAIVRNNKIMVLDEATANVDPHTDSLIQRTVRDKFVDCTVFTVAHRLHTVMDSSKILVMDGGRLVEFDHPYVLLQNKSHLYNMVQQTGSAMADILTEMAEKSFYQEKNEAPSR